MKLTLAMVVALFALASVATAPATPVAAPIVTAPTPPAPPPPAPRAPPVPAAASATPPSAQAPPPSVAAVPVTRSVGGVTGEIAFKCPRSGTIVQYSNGMTLKFTEGSGFRCTCVDQTATPREKFAAFADEAKLLNAGLDRLWPLTVGKEQTLGVTVSGGYLRQHVVLLRSETVVTPAGSFDAVVVEQEESGSGAQNAKRLFWYVPEFGLIVKSTFNLLRSADTAARAGFATATLLPGDYQAIRIEVPASK